MKKFYTLLMTVLCFGGVVNAQTNDLSVSLDNYTDGESTSDDPLDLALTITNNGDDIPAGDSIIWAIFIDGSIYSTLDLADGGTFSEAGLANGESASFSCADISMDWAYEKLGNVNGDICITVFGVGINSVATFPDWDDNPTDNAACVDYTVTEVASLEAQSEAIGNVYVINNNTLRIENEIGVFDSEATVQITSLSGQVVQSDRVVLQGSVADVELDNLTSGIYLATVMVNDKVVTKKFSIR